MKLSANLLFILAAIVGGSQATPKGDQLIFDNYDYCLCAYCDSVATDPPRTPLYYDQGLIREVREEDDGYCLTVYEGGRFPGSDYTVYGNHYNGDCDKEDPNQRFALLPVSKNFVLIQHLETGLCLDIWKNDPREDKEVNLMPCKDIADQRFHRPSRDFFL